MKTYWPRWRDDRSPHTLHAEGRRRGRQDRQRAPEGRGPEAHQAAGKEHRRPEAAASGQGQGGTSKQPPAANKIGARKNGNFKAVSTAPSINKTPMGSSTPPIPYPTTQDLSNSVAVARTVKFNGDPAYTLDRTTQPSGKGDDGGSAKGVKSGTVNGEVKPTKASGTVRAEGKHVVREGDPNTMNGGNNPGIYTTTQTPSDAPPKSAAATSNPPVQLETPNEKSAFGKWWDNAKHEMGQAVEHPWEGIKGAAKGIANIPSDIGEMLMKGAALQGAGEMEQAAAMQSLFGQTKQAEGLLQTAGQVLEGAGQIALPKLAMSNPAQAGGDKISTAVQLFAGGAGLVKSGAKGVSTLGKAGGIAETAGAAGKTAGAADAVGGAGKATEAAGTLDKTADAARTASGTTEAAGGAAKTTEATKTADAANDAGKTAQGVAAEAKPVGDGVKVVDRIKSLREKYLGRTPGKKSRTGKEVQERMRAEGKLREVEGKTEFLASDGKWYDLSKADMSHNTDAVTWWNQTGRQYGAKAPEVRDWMLDSKNYTLDHYSINRSLGAKLGETYSPPLK